MKVKIGNNIYDSEKELIMLIFESDSSKNQVVEHLKNMQPKEGVRMYLQSPKGTTVEEAEKFMDIDLKKSPKHLDPPPPSECNNRWQ